MPCVIRVLLRRSGERIPVRAADEQLRNANTILLDVREPEEFRRGHAPGARSLPLSRLRSDGIPALDALALPDDIAQVLLICQRGMRSRMAQRILSGDHRRRYVNLKGGMNAWMRAGLPITP